jgi:hypothetical protein
MDAVFRLHHLRKYDLRRGERLGHDDHIVEWFKPQRPAWMDKETYQQLPDSIRIRELRVQINQPGFRVQSLMVATTLLDAETYTQEDIAELYHLRWLVELDIRSLKITLGMDVLRCQSAEMVRREIWTCLLAYNLIRQTMLEAALKAELSPRHLSFTAALQHIAANWTVLAICAEELTLRLIAAMLQHVGAHQVGNRPNRVEPRKVKRRPKPHKLLTEPRKQAKEKLLRGIHE